MTKLLLSNAHFLVATLGLLLVFLGIAQLSVPWAMVVSGAVLIGSTLVKF